MDSNLEEEIARLSRPPSEQSAQEQQARPGPIRPGSIILHPQNGATAERRAQDGSLAQSARLRRGSSGSSQGEMSRTGSAGRMGSATGGRSSPLPAAGML